MYFVTTSLAFLLLSGCSSIQLGEGVSDEKVVERLAEARHKAMMSGDFDAGYLFATPGYRATRDLSAFKLDNAGVLNWKKAEVKGVRCEEERCEVDVDIEYKLSGLAGARPSSLGMGAATIPRTNTEVWIKLGSQWWFSRNR